jgi:hypothetical protein
MVKRQRCTIPPPANSKGFRIGNGVAMSPIQRSGIPNAAGGNCGVILGVPCDPYQFIAKDVDLIDGPNAVRWRNALLAAAQRMWNQTLLVRETWPYRALILVAIPVTADGGAKRVIHLSYTDPNVAGSKPEDIGKIEILARGQQAAIAGIHESGNQMLWFHQGSSGPGHQRFPAPPVKEGLPTFATFDDAVAATLAVLDAMAPFGFTYTMRSNHWEAKPEAVLPAWRCRIRLRPGPRLAGAERQRRPQATACASSTASPAAPGRSGA